MGLILLIIVVLLLVWGSWPARAPIRYSYGPPWLAIILIVGLILWLAVGIPLNMVCLYIALIFAIMAMLQVPANLGLIGATLTFMILSQLVGGGADWHLGSLHMFRRG
jgi:hypothetical protein